MLASTSLSFDVSVFEIFAPLTAGGSIEIVPNLLALADRAAGPWQGSMISAVPSALAQVLAAPGTRASARTVVLAGEALTARAVAAVRAAMPGARVGNIYGPTEATVYATAWSRGEPGQLRRSGGRSGIRGCSCWMGGWGWCRRGWRGSCISRGRGWRGGT